jgi:hypothetical protein
MEFFEILTEQPQNVTQKLMALVNGLAQNLKSLICLGLSVALKLVIIIVIIVAVIMNNKNTYKGN